MNESVRQLEKRLNEKAPSIRLPYWVGFSGGFTFYLLGKLSGRKFSISSVRVKKYCTITQFNLSTAHLSGFNPPYKITEKDLTGHLKRNL